MLLKLNLILVIFIFFANPILGKSVKPRIGVIKELKGAPDVLRMPSKELTDELKNRSQQEGFAIVLFEDMYWESHPAKLGIPLYYGDLLSSGLESEMVITLNDGFELILSIDTKIRLSPNFIKRERASGVGGWVNLIHGKVRAYFLNKRSQQKRIFDLGLWF